LTEDAPLKPLLQTTDRTERGEEAVMSFDILFKTCRRTGKPVVRTNPFTGKDQTVVPDEPLSPAELNAVEQVLGRASASDPDEFGCRVVRLADGSEAEVFTSEPATDCMVALRGLTADLVRFLFDLLQAGNWVMLPVMEEEVAITTSPGSMKGTPENFPRVVACNSAEELGTLLSGGVRAWEKYRNHVVGDVRGQPGE
jgi:hypothetical protein